MKRIPSVILFICLSITIETTIFPAELQVTRQVTRRDVSPVQKIEYLVKQNLLDPTAVSAALVLKLMSNEAKKKSTLITLAKLEQEIASTLVQLAPYKRLTPATPKNKSGLTISIPRSTSSSSQTESETRSENSQSGHESPQVESPQRRKLRGRKRLATGAPTQKKDEKEEAALAARKKYQKAIERRDRKLRERARSAAPQQNGKQTGSSTKPSSTRAKRPKKRFWLF